MSQLFPECGENHGVRRHANGRPLVPMAACKGCGRTFRPKRSRAATYCSRECAFKAGATAHWKSHPNQQVTPQHKAITRIGRRIRRLQKRYKNVIRTCGMCREHLGWATIGTTGACGKVVYCQKCRPKLQTLGVGYTGFRTRICMVCQKPRENRNRTDSGKRCDACEVKCKRERKRHGKHKRRARMAGKPADVITLLELIERDAGVCALCGKRVRPDWNHLHNLYPSIEHIIPIARGGSHTWDNVQLAHRVCNSRKGTKHGGQLRLW